MNKQDYIVVYLSIQLALLSGYASWQAHKLGQLEGRFQVYQEQSQDIDKPYTTERRNK